MRDLINIADYPIENPASVQYLEAVSKVRAGLAREGCAVLPRFLSEEGLAACRAETRSLAPEAHVTRRRTNPYGSGTAPDLPPEHPGRRLLLRSNGFVAGDRIGPQRALRRLYADPALQRFLADCLEVPRLHPYADPLADLVVNVLQPGCAHPWHFDNNDFIVTLLAQEAEGGGAFEYCPGLRSEADENHAGVNAVLDGERGPVKVLDLRPGDLQLFHGRHALHRVTEVAGDRERHTVIFAYSETPGVIAGVERTRRLFGRASEAHERAERAGRSVAADSR